MTVVWTDFIFACDWCKLIGSFSERGLRELRIQEPAKSPQQRRGASQTLPWEQALHRALAEYFAGRPADFGAIPLDMEVGTPFQQKVWRAALAVEWGQRVSYGELARRMGAPKSSRAVGGALGANPLCLVVPCHRVLAADGGLGGYSAGLHWKRRFLELEGWVFEK